MLRAQAVCRSSQAAATSPWRQGPTGLERCLFECVSLNLEIMLRATGYKLVSSGVSAGVQHVQFWQARWPASLLRVCSLGTQLLCNSSWSGQRSS